MLERKLAAALVASGFFWAHQACAWENLVFSQEPLPEGMKLPSKSVKGGEQGSDSKKLCEALAARGFVGDCEKGASKVQIQMAQSAYGLKDDGIADRQLYFSLALDKQTAAEMAKGNRELLESLAQKHPSGKYLVVNLPAFEVTGYEGGKAAVSSRAIVGKPDRQTPIGEMKITAIKYNPDWTPPPTIMKKSLLPSLESGGDYLQKHGLQAYDAKTGERMELDEVSAEMVRSGEVKFVQPSGDSNALGVLKFETDSKENIYLHDTNERKLFDKANRTFSSGCIRVENWMGLASWVGKQSQEQIARKLESKKTFWEKIEPVPVYVIYSLAQVEGDSAKFYPDIYKKTKYAR